MHFQVDACDPKSYSESRQWFWKLFPKSAMKCKVYTEENQNNESEGKQELKFWRGVGTIFRICVYKEASRNFLIIFLFHKAVQKFQSSKYSFNQEAFKKIFIWGPNRFKEKFCVKEKLKDREKVDDKVT